MLPAKLLGTRSHASMRPVMRPPCQELVVADVAAVAGAVTPASARPPAVALSSSSSSSSSSAPSSSSSALVRVSDRTETCILLVVVDVVSGMAVPLTSAARRMAAAWFAEPGSWSCVRSCLFRLELLVNEASQVRHWYGRSPKEQERRWAGG